MRKFLLMMLCFSISIAQVWAQQRTINGKVSDEAGKPVSGASVLVKGTSNGTTSDNSGSFSLSIPGNAKTIVISSIGFKEIELPVNARNFNVTLVAADKDLQEVVVVAYGTQKKTDVVGAVSVVSADKIARQQVVSATQALQGLAPGVLVINSTGQPGDNPVIRIRGIGSINASADPLVVVDGVPFYGNIGSLNPNDIESMNVLKDATATSLYGSRAANGVILVTSKKGRRGKDADIGFYSSYGISSRAVSEYPFVSSEQYLKLAWEAQKNFAEDVNATTPGSYPNVGQYATDNLITGVNGLRYNPYSVANPIDASGNLVAGANLLWNTDWAKEISRSSAARRNVGVTMNGGSEKARYFLSADYLNQDGYVIQSNFKRISTRLNTDLDIRKWLTVGLNMYVSSSNQNYPDQSGSAFRNAVQWGRIMPSIYPLYAHDDNGAMILDGKGQPIYDYGFNTSGRTVNYNRPVASGSNAVGLQILDKNLNDRLQTSLNTYQEIKFTNFLKFKSTFGIDRYTFTNDKYQNPLYGDAVAAGGRVAKENNLTTSWTWNNMLSYQQKFGEHTIGAMASYEAYDYKYKGLLTQKAGFPVPGLEELTSGSAFETGTSSTVRERITSYLGRLSYNYGGKYFVEGTLRRDGSSRFLQDVRWGTFYAVGASWVLSEESFIKNIDFINLLKFRGSYGEVGNNTLTSYFPYLDAYSTGYNDLTNPGIFLTSLGNPNLTWEKLGTYNIGFDFGLFKNRLNGSIEYYKKNTFDLLYQVFLPTSSGFSGINSNVGKLENSGVEVSLNYKAIATKDFMLDINVNFATLKNKITEQPQPFVQDGSFRREVGQSLNSYYIFDWAGVNPDNGKPQWYKDELDANGQPTGKRTVVNSIATATRYYRGTALPKVTGGFGSNMNYKNFDLSFLFNYAFGGKVLDSDYIGLMHGFSSNGNNLHTDILNRWTTPGQITDVPRLGFGQADYGNASTRHLYSGDYIRLRNVTLGYTIPAKTLSMQNVVKSFRLYVQADNFFTWTKAHDGLDPELNLAGQTGQRSSTFKTISAGLNVGF